MSNSSDNRSFYVYLYRDPESEVIRYVGKGTGHRVDAVLRDVYHCKDPDLLASRLAKADKQAVRRWFKSLQGRRLAPIVEIMPCKSEGEAHAVEAAFISALWGSEGLLNAVHGVHDEFAPLGLPQELSRRRYEPPLTRRAIAEEGGAIVVYIAPGSFFEGDKRRGATPRMALTEKGKDAERSGTHARIRRWWQVGDDNVRRWTEKPEASPAVVLGVTGPPSRRWVWGSLSIDRSGWNEAERVSGALYELPTRHSQPISNADLDAKKLRGRLVGFGELGPVVKRDGRRQFGGVTAQFVDVIDPVASRNLTKRS